MFVFDIFAFVTFVFWLLFNREKLVEVKDEVVVTQMNGVAGKTLLFVCI
jgi:hypothetical protein